MVDRDLDALIAADRQGQLARLAAILAQGDARAGPGRRRRGAEILYAHGEFDGLADEAKARRLLDDEPAIDLVWTAGEEDVQRCIEIEPIGRRHVVHLPIGEHDDPGEALPRHVGEVAVDVGEKLRSWIA